MINPIAFNQEKRYSVSNPTAISAEYRYSVCNLIEHEKLCKAQPRIRGAIVEEISSSINTGSVSSLYGIDKNNEFAKERISKNLASKLYRKILFIINRSEN